MSVALDCQPSLAPAASLHSRHRDRDVISAKLGSRRSHALLQLRRDMQQPEHLHGHWSSWLRSLYVLLLCCYSVACIGIKMFDLCHVVEHAVVQRQLLTRTLPRHSARCAWNLSWHRAEQRIQGRESIARKRQSKELVFVGHLLCISYINGSAYVFLFFLSPVFFVCEQQTIHKTTNRKNVDP